MIGLKKEVYHMKILFFVLLQVSLLLAKSVDVDVANSVVEFKVRHMLFTKTKGIFEKFSGHYEIDDETKKLLSLEGEVETASINTKDKKRDEYLKSEAFFDVEKYPTMTLKLLKVEDAKALVKLTIKGYSQEVLFDIKERLLLRGKISRKAFGLHFSKLAEAGGIAVGDEVAIMIALVGK